MSEELEPEQRVQERQYEFPYHYIPTLEDSFSQHRHWSWGFRYLGGVEVVLDYLSEQSFDRLVDVGCGDGRVLREIADRYPGKELLGVDYSHQAIKLAEALNPSLAFQVADVRTMEPTEAFDVATAVEVLEHIPPADLDEFVASIADLLVEDGTLILTVPHSNTSVNPKHYQHFSSSHLTDVLRPHFQSTSVTPIDARTKSLSLLQKLIGGNGNHFLVTNPRLLGFFYFLYKKYYLYADESTCGRIAAVCHK